MQPPQISLAFSWLPSLTQMAPSDSHRVNIAVMKFMDDPNNPGLNFHPIRAPRSKGLHSFRVSDDVRVLLHKQGNTYVLLEAGHHDDVYDRAQRLAFIDNPATGFIGVIETGQTEIGPATLRRTIADDSPKPLDHWSDPELRETGLSEELVAAVRTCRTDEELCNLPAAAFEVIIEIIDKTPEQWRNPPIDEEAEAEERLRASLSQYGVLDAGPMLVDADETKRVLAAPIED